jgi:hypothetical protein
MLDSSGATTLVATYKDGVLDGPWKEVTRDETAEGVLVAGRPLGTWTQTDRSGTRQLDHKTP